MLHARLLFFPALAFAFPAACGGATSSHPGLLGDADAQREAGTVAAAREGGAACTSGSGQIGGFCPQGGPGCGLDHFEQCIDGHWTCPPIPNCCYGQEVPQCDAGGAVCRNEAYFCTSAYSCGDKACRGDDVCVTAFGGTDAGDAGAPRFFCVPLARCSVFPACDCALSAPLTVPVPFCAIEKCSVDSDAHVLVTCRGT